MRASESKLIKLYRNLLSTSIPKISRGDPCLFFSFLKENIERASSMRCSLSNLLQMKTIGIPIHLKWYKLSMSQLSLQQRQLYEHYVKTSKYTIPEKHDLRLVFDSSKEFEIGHMVTSFVKRYQLYADNPRDIPDYPLPNPPTLQQPKPSVSETLLKLRQSSTTTSSSSGPLTLLSLSEKTKRILQQQRKQQWPKSKSKAKKSYSQKELTSLASRLGISTSLVQQTYKAQLREENKRTEATRIREQLVIPKNLSSPEEDPIKTHIHRLKDVAFAIRSIFLNSKTKKISRPTIIQKISSPNNLTKDDLDIILTILETQLPSWLVHSSVTENTKKVIYLSVNPNAWGTVSSTIRQLKKKYASLPE